MLSWFGVFFCSHDKTKLKKIACLLNSSIYVKMVEEDMLTWADDFMPVTWTFQQDNAPAHAARSTKDWFCENWIREMDWPVRSPDLNQIENLWEILAREFYGGYRQFTTSEDLIACITGFWPQLFKCFCKGWFLLCIRALETYWNAKESKFITECRDFLLALSREDESDFTANTPSNLFCQYVYNQFAICSHSTVSLTF